MEGNVKRALPGLFCLANAHKLCPGPASSSTASGNSSSFAIPSAKRTGFRRCRVQYSGSVNVCASTHVPVKLEMKAMRGGLKRTRDMRSRKVSSRPSSKRECAATLIRSRRLSIPRSDRRRSSCESASSDPEAMHKSGALTAAMSTARPSIMARNSASGRSTDSMPPGGAISKSCPRKTTIESASATDMTPARQAAAYSPALCPITATGLIPQLSHNLASAYSRMNSAGIA